LLEGRAIGGDVQLQAGDLVFVSRTRTPSLMTVANIISSVGWLAVLLR